jgi:vesicle coat complex subunit
LTALAKMLRNGFQPSQSLVECLLTCSTDAEPEVRREALVCLRLLAGMPTGGYPLALVSQIDQALDALRNDSDRQVRDLAQRG